MLSGREDLGPQELDGRDDVIHGAVERRGDDTRLARGGYQIAFGPDDFTRGVIENRLTPPKPLPLLVKRGCTEHEERIRLHDRFDAVVEVEAEKFYELPLRRNFAGEPQTCR